MKTMLKVTWVVALFAMANAVFASGNLKVNLVAVSGEKALVAISSLSDSNVQITLTDENQRIVYFSETTGSAENYRKVFNLAFLEPGTYKLTATCDNLTTERTFHKSKQGIKVGKEVTALEPFFSYKDGLLRCTYLNFQEDNVTLTFYDHNHPVYAKELGKRFNINEALNLAKLKHGTYKAVLSSGDKVYSFMVEN
jgi:hypothetical protein